MAAERNITIYQGDTYLHDITITDSSNAAIDITDRTYLAQMRPFPGSNTITANFTVQLVSPSNGQLRLSLSAQQTSNISTGVYSYDLQETNNNVVLTLMAGSATVLGQVTL